MFTDAFTLSPVCCRLFLKALLAIQRNSEVVILSRILDAGSVDNGGRKAKLVLSSIDSAGSTILSFDFPPEFFMIAHVSHTTLAGLSTPTVVGSKNTSKMFRGVSPNKILSAQLRISVDTVQLEFYWKNGVVSSRTVEAMTPSEGSQLPPSILPDPRSRPRIVIATFAPKFFNNLLLLIPDSTTLWSVIMSHRVHEVSQPLLYLTNSVTHTESVSVVEIALNQAELNRNGSYFSHVELRENESVSMPLAELKHLTGIASDETLKDSFSIVIGFEDCGTWNQTEPVLTVQAVANVVPAQPQCAFAVSLYYRGCAPPFRDPGDNFVDTTFLFEGEEEVNDISPIHDDLLFAQAADAMEAAYDPVRVRTSFIETTLSQTCQPTLPPVDATVIQETQQPAVPEWDMEIPSTPTAGHGITVLMDDLWD